MKKVLVCLTTLGFCFVNGVTVDKGIDRIWSNTNQAPLPEIAQPTILEFPTGDEIGVQITKLGPRKAVVRVTNRSSKTVFLPYLPGIYNPQAFYAILGLQKFDAAAGRFQSHEGGCIGTGWNPLEPGEFYTYGIYVAERGTYRINIRYLVDRHFRNRIERMDSDFFSGVITIAEWRTEIDYVLRDLESAAGEISSRDFNL